MNCLYNDNVSIIFCENALFYRESQNGFNDKMEIQKNGI